MKLETPLTFCECARQQRYLLGLTQEQVAHAAGLSRRNLQKIEDGSRRNIMLVTCLSLARVVKLVVTAKPVGPDHVTKIENPMVFARLAQTQRAALSLTQDQVADATGISPRNIQRIENGENAGLDQILAVARTLRLVITVNQVEHIPVPVLPREDEGPIMPPDLMVRWART